MSKYFNCSCSKRLDDIKEDLQQLLMDVTANIKSITSSDILIKELEDFSRRLEAVTKTIKNQDENDVNNQTKNTER